MPTLCYKNRRESTKMRDSQVHQLYNEIIHNLGDLASVVSKSYIYQKIQERTRLSIRTISFILNHTPG